MNGSVKGAIFIIILITVLLIIGYYETKGFGLPAPTTPPPPHAKVTPTTPTTNNSTVYAVYGCNNYSLVGYTNSTQIGACKWKGGNLGIWLETGKTNYINISIIGQNNKTYVNQSYIPYSCNTYYSHFYAPAQIYYITISSSKGDTNGPCTNNYTIITTNTSIPIQIANKTYYDFYQGSLSTGTYIGWNTSGTAFGNSPIDLTKANKIGCYPKDQWENYSDIYYISSYNCDPIETTGNITSSKFLVDEPFLNFQIISPNNKNDYVELISPNGNYTYLTDSISTYNVINDNGSVVSQGYKLEDASIPISKLLGKIVRFRVVQGSNQNLNYIVIGDIEMSNTPKFSLGVKQSLNFTK